MRTDSGGVAGSAEAGAGRLGLRAYCCCCIAGVSGGVSNPAGALTSDDLLVAECTRAIAGARPGAGAVTGAGSAWCLGAGEAVGEATAFDKVYEQYRLAPEVTRKRMYYETMERVLKKVDKTIVEAPGVTPYLPLPQVQRSQQQQQQQGNSQ